MKPNTVKSTRPRRRLWGVAVGSVAALGLATFTPASGEPSPRANDSDDTGRVALVQVDTPTHAESRQLASLDLDGGTGGQSEDHTSVVLIGEADRAKLRDAGLSWTVEVPDLEQRNREARQEEDARMRALPGHAKNQPGAEPGALTPPDEVMPSEVLQHELPPQALSRGRSMPEAASSLPSGRVSYRTLVQINNELRYLAATYPDTAKLIELPHTSLQGAPIYGLEITHDVETDQGKPVFLSTGVTHAREWPTAEYTMEYAWHLLLEDGSDPRITGLLDQTRTILVPVVNVDGFDISRSLVEEFKRKNCRMEAGEIPAPNECSDPANIDLGVDLNRNQGAYWGDIGASPDPTSGTFRGAGPFSEPEIKNMRYLLSNNPVAIYNANHTYGEYVLRGPSNANEPTPPDEDQWAALAQAMAAENGYEAGPPFELLYSTSGTSEETGWTATSTFSFEFEHGSEGFHPPYETVAAEWEPNRNAYLVAHEAAGDPDTHSILNVEGAPEGAELKLSKQFTMYTAPVLQLDDSRGNVLPVPMSVEVSATMPAGGELEWHVQPSLRPSQAHTAYIQESYTLTCEDSTGNVAQTETVTIARGEEVSVDLSSCAGE